MTRNNVSMDGGVASPLLWGCSKVYGFIVLDHPSAVSLSLSFIIKNIARCIPSVKTSAHKAHIITQRSITL